MCSKLLLLTVGLRNRSGGYFNIQGTSWVNEGVMCVIVNTAKWMGIARVYFRVNDGGLIIPCRVHLFIEFVAFLAWILYSSVSPHCTTLGFRSGDVTESKSDPCCHYPWEKLIVHGLGEEKKGIWGIWQRNLGQRFSQILSRRKK